MAEARAAAGACDCGAEGEAAEVVPEEGPGVGEQAVRGPKALQVTTLAPRLTVGPVKTAHAAHGQKNVAGGAREV